MLESGITALKQERFVDAIQTLEAFLQTCSNVNSRNYLQAQTSLAKAYQGNGDTEKAIALCRTLLETDNTALKSWATKALAALLPPEAIAAASLKPTLPPPEGTTSHSNTPVVRQPLPHETSPVPHKVWTVRSASSTPQKTALSSSATSASGTVLLNSAFVGTLLSLLKHKLVRSALIFAVFGLVRGCFWMFNHNDAPVQAVFSLSQAAAAGDVTEVQQLIADGADVNAADATGRTALFWAVSGCVPEIEAQATVCHSTDANAVTTQLLLTKGANANAQDLIQSTPLHWAAQWGSQATAELLLAKGANINAANAFGETPLAVAQKQGNQVMMMFLQQRGAQ